MKSITMYPSDGAEIIVLSPEEDMSISAFLNAPEYILDILFILCPSALLPLVEKKKEGLS